MQVQSITFLSKVCLFTLTSIIFFFSCNGQVHTTKPTSIVGGACENCDLIFESMPVTLKSSDTSAGWFEKAQKLIITGKVFQADGKTPAAGVIVYYWHTDSKGLYSRKPGLSNKALQHGYLRGWVKSDVEGNYAIHTLRPAPYPKDIIPAHIHLLIKEQDIPNPYYTDDLVFDEDPLLLANFKKYPPKNRAGSGILRVLIKSNVQIAEHDIILGLNIPNHPATKDNKDHSGLSIGEDQPSFIPYHAYGPDKGSRTCPVCKYGRYHGIIYYVGNRPNWSHIKQWLSFLENCSTAHKDSLKTYFVYGNEKAYNESDRQKLLETIGKELHIKHLALTYVPSMTDTETEINLNNINPDVENTIIIYKHRRIVGKFIDLIPTKENFKKITTVLTNSKGSFFHLKELPHD